MPEQELAAHRESPAAPEKTRPRGPESTSRSRFTVFIDKTTNHFGGQALRRGDSQQVGQQRAVVPAEMPVGAVLIISNALRQ